MYSIGDIAQLTGITAFTLRYYEKVGVLPEPRRQAGSRRYDEEDLRYIRFIHSLKQTGMSLEDIAAFTEDGCLLSRMQEEPAEITGTLRRRVQLLDRHIERLNEQIRRLETVKQLAQRKNDFYSAALNGNQEADRW